MIMKKKILYQKDNHEIFNEKKLTVLLDRFYAGKFKYTSIIYKILSIKIWLNLFFDEK